MAERVIEITGLEELTRKLDKHGRLDEDVYFPIHDAMSEAVQQIEAEAKDNLTRNGSVAFGHLRASISSEVRVTADRVEGVVGTSLGSQKVGYAMPVEYGSRPHWAPLQPLIEWVRVKGLAGTYSVRTGRRMGSRMSQLAQDTALARAIQVKIARYGTKARPFFWPAVDAKRAEIQRLFEKAVEQIVKNFPGGR